MVIVFLYIFLHILKYFIYTFELQFEILQNLSNHEKSSVVFEVHHVIADIIDSLEIVIST